MNRPPTIGSPLPPLTFRMSYVFTSQAWSARIPLERKRLQFSCLLPRPGQTPSRSSFSDAESSLSPSLRQRDQGMRDTGCRAPWWARLCSPASPVPGGSSGLTLRAAAVAFSSALRGRRAGQRAGSAPLPLPQGGARLRRAAGRGPCPCRLGGDPPRVRPCLQRHPPPLSPDTAPPLTFTAAPVRPPCYPRGTVTRQAPGSRRNGSATGGPSAGHHGSGRLRPAAASPALLPAPRRNQTHRRRLRGVRV